MQNLIYHCTYWRTTATPHKKSGEDIRCTMHKWGVTSSATCECGLKEQISDHVVFQSPFYYTPCESHVLKKPDIKTISWLLKTCSNI